MDHKTETSRPPILCRNAIMIRMVGQHDSRSACITATGSFPP